MSKEKLKNAVVSIIKKLNWKDGVFLSFSLFMGIYLKWNFFEVAIFLIFIYIILHPVESRIMAMPALFFLVLTPFFLVFKQEIIAEKLAIYCYYFLIMTVMMGIYEVRQEDRNREEVK
jgi:hypothetical protein